MKPKKGVTTVSTPLAVCWMELHTLCVVLNDEKPTPTKIQRHYETLKNILRSQYCCLVEIKHLLDYSEETKEMISRRLPSLYRLLAIITTPELMDSDAMGFYMELNSEKLPVKVFTSEKAARAWLRGKIPKRMKEAESRVSD